MLAPANYCFLHQELFCLFTARKKGSMCTFNSWMFIHYNTISLFCLTLYNWLITHRKISSLVAWLWMTLFKSLWKHYRHTGSAIYSKQSSKRNGYIFFNLPTQPSISAEPDWGTINHQGIRDTWTMTGKSCKWRERKLQCSDPTKMLKSPCQHFSKDRSWNHECG